VKDDYDRLAEVSPPLPEESIAFFKANYKEGGVSKPEEANGLTAIHVFVEPSVVMTPTPVAPPPSSGS